MINRSRKFIFVGITKTASSSIFRFFMNNGLTEVQGKYETLALGDLYTRQHTPIIDIEQGLPHLKFEDYYKFAFVRHPYERHKSLWKWLIKHANLKADINTFTVNALKGVYPHPMRYMPQIDWLKNSQGQILCDFVGKVETLNEDFEKLCKVLDPALENVTLTTENAITASEDETMLSPESKKLLADYYEQDFLHFGYDK